MNEDTDFSKYGKSFQETLAHIIFEDRPFSDQIEEVLDINFFELKYLRVFVDKVFDYKQRYEVHPSPDAMQTIIRTALEDENEAVQKQVRDYFIKISTLDVKDIDYVKEVSLDFCKKQKLKAAIVKSVSLLQRSSFDEIRVIIDEALKLGTDNNFGHDYKRDFEKRYSLKARNPISTGWPEIDKLCKGGLGKGELGVVIAPTGAGKSMALAHLGAAAVNNGCNVVHYTLELSEEVVGLRYDSCLSGIRLKDLFALKEQIYEACVDIEGELVIKEYPTKSASTGTIKKHLDKLRKKGQRIDMVIVDYGDLLRPSTSYREKRMELESIYEEMRAIAQEFECPVWTASQTNRSGLNAEVITMESISEAFNKCFVSDFIFSISRTIKDKNANTGRMFVAKNRNGPDGLIYPLFMDTSNVKIKVLPPTDETYEEIQENAEKNYRQDMKDKYKKFKKNSGS